MTDLRKAAEQALDFMDWLCGDDNSDRPKYTALNLESFLLLARTELRQALAEDALKTVADIDHSIGLFIDSPKEWVGLTDEEINDWFFQRLKQAGAGWALDDVVRSVEAKLKEKNS